MDRKAVCAIAAGMNPLRAALSIALAIAVSLWPRPSVAMQAAAPASEYAAEHCIGYSRTSADSFALVNNCDWQVVVAVCAEAAGMPCSTADRYAHHMLAMRARLPQSYSALQTLNIFACKSPAVVQIGQNGLAGCDPTGLANLPLLLASALKNAASIITPGDYPAGIKAEGNTRFEMRVGADGKPQSCFIAVSSGKEALDKATCNAFMKRARFTPAKDSGGKPTDGRYRGSVTWKAQ